MENDICMGDMPPTYQQLARVIGIENVIKLGREFGGELFYLPKLNLCLAKVRKRKIIEEYKGGNYRELSMKYGVTSAWVRQIVTKHRREKVSNIG